MTIFVLLWLVYVSYTVLADIDLFYFFSTKSVASTQLRHGLLQNYTSFQQTELLTGLDLYNDF